MIDLKAAALDQPEPSDPPPRYDPLDPLAAPPSSSHQLIIPEGKRVNHLYISRTHESIKGTYIVDPSLQIPDAFLPPLTDDENKHKEERKNLRLSSHHSNIDAEVYLVQNGPARNKKTRLAFSSNHSLINIRLHASDKDRDPFQLTAISHHSSVTLCLPRSFHGPLQLSTKHGSIQFSPELTPHITTFSEDAKTRKCFVGDFSGWTGSGTGSDEWSGDEVSLSSKHGSIRVKFVDEVKKVDPVASVAKATRSTLFGKMAGAFGSKA